MSHPGGAPPGLDPLTMAYSDRRTASRKESRAHDQASRTPRNPRIGIGIVQPFHGGQELIAVAVCCPQRVRAPTRPYDKIRTVLGQELAAAAGDVGGPSRPARPLRENSSRSRPLCSCVNASVPPSRGGGLEDESLAQDPAIPRKCDRCGQAGRPGPPSRRAGGVVPVIGIGPHREQKGGVSVLEYPVQRVDQPGRLGVVGTVREARGHLQITDTGEVVTLRSRGTSSQVVRRSPGSVALVHDESPTSAVRDFGVDIDGLGRRTRRCHHAASTTGRERSSRRDWSGHRRAAIHA